MGKLIVVRVSGLSQNLTVQGAEDHLGGVIRENCTPVELGSLTYTIDIVPSCYIDSPGWVAILRLQEGLPDFLKDVQNQRISIGSLTFDATFGGFTQLYQTVDNEAITADIIAITGLAGHAFGSWLSKRAPYYIWLRDFLGSDFPRCRTLTYGYDSKLLKSDGSDTIEDIGSRLMVELEGVRGPPANPTVKRPMIILAHSLGGLLVSDCLVRREYPHFAIATHAVMFFGTPHRGMETEALYSILKSDEATFASGVHPRNQLLNSISQKDPFLAYRIKQLKAVISDKVSPIRICTLYETHETADPKWNSDIRAWTRDGPKRLLVPKDNAVLGTEKSSDIISVPLNHSDMVKFDTDQDPHYRAVARKLTEYVAEIQGLEMKMSSKSTSPTLPQVSEQDKSVVRSILAPVTLLDLPTFCLKGTREEVLQHVDTWIASTDKDILWIFGQPGSGKTTIASSIFRNHRTRCARFFFDRREERLRNPKNVWRTVGCQLAKLFPGILVVGVGIS